jgi:hypothetical protein
MSKVREVLRTEKSDANTLLVGSGQEIMRVSDTELRAAMAKLPERFATRLAFMTPDHHLVRDFAVRELPYENGNPIKSTAPYACLKNRRAPWCGGTMMAASSKAARLVTLSCGR